MALHDPDDIVTAYFVLKEKDGVTIIQGWSEDKNLVKSYMEFHNCKKFRVKKVTLKAKLMYEKYEENLHDEITIFHIGTKDKNHPGEIKTIPIPATTTEFNLINEETNTLVSSMIPYSYMNGAILYLKRKYRKALADTKLLDFIENVLHGQRSKFLENIQFDQLILLYKLFSDNFD